MQGIGPRVRGHIDRAGGSQVLRQVQGRLAELELGNRACRNVRGRRADSLIADVDTIHIDSRRTAKAAAEGNRGETRLGRVEVLAVLDLHTGLKLGQIKEVSPVDRQVIYLVCSYNTLHSGL